MKPGLPRVEPEACTRRFLWWRWQHHGEVVPVTPPVMLRGLWAGQQRVVQGARCSACGDVFWQPVSLSADFTHGMRSLDTQDSWAGWRSGTYGIYDEDDATLLLEEQFGRPEVKVSARRAMLAHAHRVINSSASGRHGDYSGPVSDGWRPVPGCPLCEVQDALGREGL